MQKRHPKLAEWVKKYQTRAKKEPTLGASWGYASAYIIAEAIKRAKSADTDKVITAFNEGFEMEFPWGKVIMMPLDVASGRLLTRVRIRARKTSDGYSGSTRSIFLWLTSLACRGPSASPSCFRNTSRRALEPK